MRFVRAIWKLLVGIKDALVLLFMLMFFGLLYAACIKCCTYTGLFNPHPGFLNPCCFRVCQLFPFNGIGSFLT